MNQCATETHHVTDTRIIPAWAKEKGLTRCFVYVGPSMRPTFRYGHLLYVRPDARDLVVGDVVVFANSAGDGYIVHRIVSITDAGLVTRGDNNLLDDPPVTAEYVIGRVEMVEDQMRFKPVLGGWRGLWWVRVRVRLHWASGQLRRVFGAPYRAARAFPAMRRLLNRRFPLSVVVVRFKTPDGDLVKVIRRGQVVARRFPGQARPQIQKPFDLWLTLDDIPTVQTPD